VGNGYKVDGEVEEEEMRMSDDLFDDPESDPIADAPDSKTVHFGCPLAWVQRVLPLVHSAEQLAIAIWLHRRRIVCGGKEWFKVSGKEWFTVPAKTLEEELGLSRHTRYRAFKHLEQAGGIAISRNGNRAMRVKLRW
jgi:hypothetical protein